MMLCADGCESYFCIAENRNNNCENNFLKLHFLPIKQGLVYNYLPVTCMHISSVWYLVDYCAKRLPEPDYGTKCTKSKQFEE